MQESAKSSFYLNILKSIKGKYLTYAFNILSLSILARLISPESYGLVASILVIYVFFKILSESGLTPAIINLDNLKTKDKNGLFTFTLLLGIFLSLIFNALKSSLINFYGNDSLAVVIDFTSLSIIFFSISSLPLAFLQRDKLFGYLAVVGILAEIISTGISIALFYFYDELIALSSKLFTSAVCTFLFSLILSKYTSFGVPALGIKLSAVRKVFNFAKYQFMFSFVNYFSRNLDHILVGKFLGFELLAIYEKSYQLMRYPLVLLTNAISPAIQPVIREHSSNNLEVSALHNDFLRKGAMISAAIGIILFTLAPWIVRIILGENWIGVIPILQIFSISIPTQLLLSSTGSFFQGMSKPKLLFYSGVFSAITMVFAILLGIKSGNLNLLSLYVVIAITVNFFQAYYLLCRYVFKSGYTTFLKNIYPIIITCPILLLLNLGNI